MGANSGTGWPPYTVEPQQPSSKATILKWFLSCSTVYLLQIEPLFSLLINSLPAISFGVAMESVFAYINDVDILGQSEEDLLLADTICRCFKAMSGVIINRNRKSAILGLGTWAGSHDWPLP